MRSATGYSAERKLAPGPQGFVLLGNLLNIRRDRLAFLMQMTAQYGDIVRFRMGNKTLHLIFRPAYIKHVLQDNYQNYHKGIGLAQAKPFLGNGLLTNEGADWLRQRRLIQPAFHRQRISQFTTVITDTTAIMLEQWQAHANSRIDVAPEMMRLTLEILGKALFSTDMRDQADTMGRALTVLLEEAIHRMVAFVDLPQSWPTPRNRRFQHALHTLDTLVFRMIDQRRSNKTDAEDLLSMLLHAQDDDTHDRMSDRQLRDEVVTILFAGHETTAVALSWIWHLLATHPLVERKLHQEVATVLGSRTPTLQDVPNLKYTKMVIEEALRLYPPVWLLPRKAVTEDMIGDYYIPAGSGVLISPYALHRHPTFWDNPDTFDPERFAEEQATSRPPYAYFPFGGGPHYCIGSNFAMLEAQLIVAMVSQRFQFQCVPGHQPKPDPLLTLRSANGTVLQLLPRASS